MLSTSPPQGAVAVPVNSALRAIFAEPAAEASVTVSAGGAPVPGTVTCVDNTVLFLPSVDLSADTSYTVAMVVAVPDGGSARVSKSCSWTFSTGPLPAVHGTLLPGDTGSLPLEGVEVRSEDGATVAGVAGRYSFAALPPGKHLLVAEQRFSSGTILRVLGVATAYVTGAPLGVDIRMGDFTDGYTFCIDCHPFWDNVTRGDQIPRCVAMPPLDPAPCETCHTLHREVGFGHFCWGDLGTVCNQCHASG